ncbi:molybdopterin-binding protein [Tropicimonas sp. IMCC34043]|uniref:molybdopterin-binding protein n=1 Tax=Tropicimonas sp. IMCC34043 TaxID=2248760 RepID=UPI000E27CFDC|nr:molybdopterin-binding protein [Tropicimonas sp. IMCC34043]
MITPPPLRNDCFALPPGVDWVPVDVARARLRAAMAPVVGHEVLPLAACAGRILAVEATAPRAHPPVANSAVDGYGFAGPLPEGAADFSLLSGRAAAGGPYGGTVPPGAALRILTGAILPPGVDTVAMQEDVTRTGPHIALQGPLKRGANARAAGEDVRQGAAILPAGRRLQPQDLALAAAVGLAELPVFRRLKVGVLSTGDELVAPGGIPPEAMAPGRIFDANRPMLLAELARWGFEPVDLGIAPDDRARLRAHLEKAAGQVDALMTSGGVSTGDEDHVAAILRSEGQIESWRIAIKPGRPLALGLWHGKPVFGFPGNPVAVMICALVFARPALEVLAGGDWFEPQGFLLPAGFTKSKKPGRAEFLRARIAADGRVETFRSEGSGRISGLSWATGLVALDDGAREIAPGDPVRYLPFTGFDG